MTDDQPAETLPDGVYFALPEAEYHALPRLSSSGIKDILVSLPTYWANSAMNPHREEVDADTHARILGRAYHTAIFEPGQLDARFVCEPDPADYPDALMTDAAVKAALKEMGETQTKAGELAADRAFRLVDAGYGGEIWSVVKAMWEEDLDNRTPIAAKYWHQIERDIARIDDNPEIADLVHGGFAEVSILWTCPETFIPMKARIDKLKSDYFLDLKSFANSSGKPVNRFVADAIRYNRYYIQARLYQQAISAIRELNLEVQDEECGKDAAEMVSAIRDRDLPHRVWYFFQEKGGVPNMLCRQIMLQNFPAGVEEQMIGVEDHRFKPSDTILCQKADMEIAHAKRLYAQAMEIYGDDQPWYPLDMLGQISDGDFSDFWLDEVL